MVKRKYKRTVCQQYMPDKETNNTEKTFSPNAYYRKVHPEYFSDSKVQYDVDNFEEVDKL